MKEAAFGDTQPAHSLRGLNGTRRAHLLESRDQLSRKAGLIDLGSSTGSLTSDKLLDCSGPQFSLVQHGENNA